GAVAQGTKTINFNRQGLLVWPTTSKVVRFEPNKTIAFVVPINGTVWSFDIEPTATGVRLTQRREAPAGGTSKISQFLVDKFLGGNDDFEAALDAGMNDTLARIKKDVETSAATTA
ncbi:MAG: SRPBCC family protein, partial [Rhodococcus sp.]|nr:SRPBCC family protein [Rhodococcus sp. (in: high G+C Gram-positive bacteria)]